MCPGGVSLPESCVPMEPCCLHGRAAPDLEVCRWPQSGCRLVQLQPGQSGGRGVLKGQCGQLTELPLLGSLLSPFKGKKENKKRYLSREPESLTLTTAVIYLFIQNY